MRSPLSLRATLTCFNFLFLALCIPDFVTQDFTWVLLLSASDMCSSQSSSTALSITRHIFVCFTLMMSGALPLENLENYNHLRRSTNLFKIVLLSIIHTGFFKYTLSEKDVLAWLCTNCQFLAILQINIHVSYFLEQIWICICFSNWLVPKIQLRTNMLLQTVTKS